MKSQMIIKSYSELIVLSTFEDRFKYLEISGTVGEETFGYDRYLNQIFYTSTLWKNFRNKIIVRDLGCDLGVKGRDIMGSITIHHINPVTVEDIKNCSKALTDPENVISTSAITHRAIHYGNVDTLFPLPIDRHPNDTCPWK